MNTKEENMDLDPQEYLWESEAAFLAGLPRTTPYRVPDQYFDNLQSRINQSVFLANLQKEQGFKVPEKYFDELGIQIETRIAIANLREKVQNDGFTVPSDYFNTLQADILRQTAETKQPVKIVKLWRSTAAKYATAACVLILVASGLYLNEQQKINETANLELASEHLLYDIDETVIFEHLQESQATNSASTTATDAEMENYILTNFSSNDLANNL